MSQIITFDSTVAARTRAAAQILATPALLASYEARGGIQEDLEHIRDHGLAAEALSQAQSAAQAQGGAATLAVLGSFVALQKEYSAVMAVVQAARRDLEKAKAPIEVQSAVDKILVNEAEVTFKSVVDRDGKAQKKAVKSASQEALRAEIARDARALLDLASFHNALEKRKVNSPRLNQIIVVAESLSGKLAGRATAKGAQKAATTALHDAVSEQKLAWSACYRLLASLGHDDARVAHLLSEAAAPRAKKAKKTKKDKAKKG
jgi:vacuolar-type H+-ATPase subunit I/STV1